MEQLITTQKIPIKINSSGEVLFEILKNVPTRKHLHESRLSFLVCIGCEKICIVTEGCRQLKTDLRRKKIQFPSLR
jgi:hypothetical protein